jgi:thioredoxin:protein disulfide reductase
MANIVVKVMRNFIFMLFLLSDKFARCTDLSQRFSIAISHGQILFPLILAILAGFLASLSPCVYPLIPITLSIMGARKYENHLQGFLVALAYVTGMSVLYTILGVSFAFIGILLGSTMQHPLILIFLAIIFITLSLSMLEAFDFVLPEKLSKKLIQIGGQGFKGAFLMGLVAGIVAAPCTGPILGAILALIAQEKNLYMGILLMLSFSIGMGLPFLILATFSSAISRIPKSGHWMKKIKYILGAAILGVGFFYLALVINPLKTFLHFLQQLGFIPLVVFLSIGFSLLVIRSKYLTSKYLQTLQIIFGAVLLAVILASFMSANFSSPWSEKIIDAKLSWHIIDADTNNKKIFEELLLQAKENQQPVMVDFFADWCAKCIQLEKNTFRHKKIAAMLRNFLLIKIDVTKNSDYLSQLQNRLGVTGLPTILFFDKNGNLLDAKILGFLPPQQFFKRLKQIL